MTTTPATYTYADGETVDTSTGEEVSYTRQVGPYHSPREEEWITHDYPMRGSALVPVRDIKEIVLGTKRGEGVPPLPKEERIRRARELTRYMDGPTEEAKRYIGKQLRMVGAFEFTLPPFEKKDPQTGKTYMEHRASIQKMLCILPDNRRVMLRFGAESAAAFVAKWVSAFRDFTFEEGDYVDFVLGTEGARNRYTFEEVA